MRSYGKKYNLKKIISEESKRSAINGSLLHLKLTHKIFDTVNISLITLVFILFIISLNSQREWSKTFKNLSRTIEKNNNLIEYISKTEEFYISKLDSLKNFKTTSPEDLIYLDNVGFKREKILNKKLKYILNGFKNRRYQKGY